MVSLFVGSTFIDFKNERELLSSTLLPRLKSYLYKYGEDINLIPFYFDKKQTDKFSFNNIETTIDSIFASKDNEKSFMILFIGDKYGWINEDEILEKTEIDNNKKTRGNIEIEYLNFLKNKFKDKIIFYVRDLDKEYMNENNFEKYDACSCLEKEKRKELIEEIYHNFPSCVRTYKAKYDKEKDDVIVLTDLIDSLEKDLVSLFVSSYSSNDNLSWQKRADIIPSSFLIEKVKHYYPNIEVISMMDDPYLGYLYYAYPILTIISGDRGSGKTSLLAYKYKNSKNDKVCFIFDKDKYSRSLSSFVKRLIYKVEEKLNVAHTQYLEEEIDDISSLKEVFLTLFNLLIKLPQGNIIDVYVDNANDDFLSFLLNIQYKYLKALGEKYYEKFPLHFYVVFSSDTNIPSICPLYDVSHRIRIIKQEDKQIKREIVKEISRSYRENLSDDVIEHIISKQDSSSPFYLKMILHRLNNDYRYFKDNLKDEIKEKHIVDLIDSLPPTIPSLAVFLIEEISKICDENDLYKTLISIGFSFKKVNKQDIKDIFNYMKWEFKDDVFEDVKNLIGVISRYNEYSDTFYMDVRKDHFDISYFLNRKIKEKGLFKYLGSLSSYFMKKGDIDALLKLAFIRIDVALNNDDINDDQLNIYMDYLFDVFNFVLVNLSKRNYGKKYTAQRIAKIISWAISRGFSKAILIFVGFANNYIKQNPQFASLFKAFFYYTKSDFSSIEEVSKVVALFNMVFDQIENTPYFGDYNNDFSLWLKINFSLLNIKYFSLASPYRAKEELDALLAFFNDRDIVLPSFYKMQIYATYLTVIANSKDKKLFESVFINDIYSYFPLNDPDNLNYLRKENLETIYKAKIDALIAVALANCYGDDKKNIFVPLVDRACEIFEYHAEEYELTHFNSATFTSLLLVESLATPMYKKDPYVLYGFRYDARKYYVDSYFVLEAETSYYYWKIMMEDIVDKREIYLKYLTRRRALAMSSNLLEAYRQYILVYAEFLEYVQDYPSVNFKYHLIKFFEALKHFTSLFNDDDYLLDSLLVIGQFYESCRIHGYLDLAKEMNDLLLTRFDNSDCLIKQILNYLYKYYVMEEEVSELALTILEDINRHDNSLKFSKIKQLFSLWEL